jgi:hypothetical protein
MRLYFHLAAVHDSILDEVGIEVEDLDDARSEAIRAIADMKVEDHSSVQNFGGWRLDVTDASGAVVFSIHFAEP